MNWTKLIEVLTVEFPIIILVAVGFEPTPLKFRVSNSHIRTYLTTHTVTLGMLVIIIGPSLIKMVRPRNHINQS